MANRECKFQLMRTTPLRVLCFNFLGLSVLSCSNTSNPEKLFRGYPNETIFKILHTTKILKLIETEHEVHADLQIYKRPQYKKVDSISIQLDIYKQELRKENAPVLIFIHGGSWSKGKRSGYIPYLIDNTMKGFATVTILQRQIKLAKFPAAFEDAKCAISWIKDHDRENGIDSSRIAPIGDFAGCHLTFMEGYDSKRDVNSCKSKSDGKVKAIANFYGLADLTTSYAKEQPEVTNFPGKNWQATPELFVAASPKTYNSSDDPPTPTFPETLDSLEPVTQADSLNNWLKNAEINHHYYRLKRWPHNMDLAGRVIDYYQFHMDHFLKVLLCLIDLNHYQSLVLELIVDCKNLLQEM